ncbi:MAG TPA: DUF4386 domain-containing protein [Gemmatimonadaceae bacterium]|jgi:hypothetical protein|nr:DUF4386 domain-containing protein [Gemmatimonadaceae bacterium]
MATAVQPSPLVTARMAGALWLAVIIVSSLAVAAPTIVVPGDTAATAHNILGSELAFRLGVVEEFVGGAFYVGVTVLLYTLLKPVSRNLALFAAACGVIGITVGAGLTVRDLGLVAILRFAESAPAQAPAMQAIAQSAIMAFGLGFKVSMVYFGLQCATVGYLIARSGFMPRAVGILLGIGGSFYVISSLTYLVSPTLGSVLSPVVIPIAFLGEGTTTLWLLFKGVNVEKWRQRAGSSTLGLAAA